MESAKNQGRDYQLAALASAFSNFSEGNTSVLVVLPTGTGKTVCATLAAEKAWTEFGRRTLFIAERRHLIRQAHKTMKAAGLKCAIEMGKERAQDNSKQLGHANVVFATTATLAGDRLAGWNQGHFGLIVTDECHHGRSASHRRIYDHFQGYWHIGLTATPGRGDGKNLGKIFPVCAYHYTLKQAIKDRWLAHIDPRTLQVQVDLRSIKMNAGDMNLGDLSERIAPKVEELCDALVSEIGDKHGVVFTPDVASATAVAAVLNAKGITAKWVAGRGGKFKMKAGEQEDVMAEFNRYGFQAIVCCDLLIEGWDVAHVEFVAVMRPTNSPHRYTQMVGRGTRRCDAIGKTHVTVLDFDWQSDDSSRNLISCIDLFDDGHDPIPPKVKKEAKRLLDTRKGLSLSEAMDMAEKTVWARPVMKLKLSGKKAKYKVVVRDPSGIARLLGVKFKSRYDMDKSGTNPASLAQIKMLNSLGMHHTERVSKWGASKLIKELLKREKSGLAMPEQVATMVSMGLDRDLAAAMKYAEAADMIGNKPVQQGELYK